MREVDRAAGAQGDEAEGLGGGRVAGLGGGGLCACAPLSRSGGSEAEERGGEESLELHCDWCFVIDVLCCDVLWCCLT